jgi:hypothetical protein
MNQNKLLAELQRLEKWWRNDAAYRPPEDHLQAYALGNADAYKQIYNMIIQEDTKNENTVEGQR